MRKVHKLNVFVNGIWFLYVHIDPHVFERHGESITDQIIFDLVLQLHMRDFDHFETDKNGFKYFADELTILDVPYRLVWLTPPDNSYIGVRTAFRRNKHAKKN